MASDKTRALLSLVKVIVALAAGYGIYYFWNENRAGLDEYWVPYAAGIVVAAVVFFLLTKMSKSGD
jgi:succinate dehydrogenase hydrophobic anchor subunit